MGPTNEPLVYKGRQISTPLTEDDRAFLLARGQDARVIRLDQQHEAARQRAILLGESTEEEVDPTDDYRNWTEKELREEAKARDLTVKVPKDENAVEYIAQILEQNDAAEVTTPPVE